MTLNSGSPIKLLMPPKDLARHTMFLNQTADTLNPCPSPSNESRRAELTPSPLYETLANQVLQAPYSYVCALPSKGVRSSSINSLNNWLKVPEDSLNLINEIIKLLHNSSLILDDFQDRSPLRRGRPSTHTIFGPAQAINSSSYAIVDAIAKIQSISSIDCAKSAIDKIVAIFRGQAMDLHWTYNSECPSIDEYMQMISDKTGGLFELTFELLAAHATVQVSQNALLLANRLMALLGRYFQIRDDYQNLMSADYASQKGFCEDLDEGKYSLPLLHCLHSKRDNVLLQYVLSTRREVGHLTTEQKKMILEQLKACGSLEWTKSGLRELYSELTGTFEMLEVEIGNTNPDLMKLVEKLHI